MQAGVTLLVSVSIGVGIQISSSSVDKTTSYFGIMAFDLKHISLFDGSDSGQLIVEWFEKAELICRLSGVKHIECVVPMHLSSGTYAVYQQLSKEKHTDIECIKTTLYTAFALDPFATLKQFAVHHLQPGETVNIFLVELRRFAVLFGGMLDQCLQCAFIAGLSEHAEELLWVSYQMEDLDLSHVLAQACAILENCTGVTEQVAVAMRLVQCTSKETDVPLRCYKCDRPNHRASDCLLGCETFRGACGKS